MGPVSLLVLKVLAICPGQMLAFPLQTVGTLAQQIANRGEEEEEEEDRRRGAVESYTTARNSLILCFSRAVMISMVFTVSASVLAERKLQHTRRPTLHSTVETITSALHHCKTNTRARARAAAKATVAVYSAYSRLWPRFVSSSGSR